MFAAPGVSFQTDSTARASARRNPQSVDRQSGYSGLVKAITPMATINAANAARNPKSNGRGK